MKNGRPKDSDDEPFQMGRLKRTCQNGLRSLLSSAILRKWQTAWWTRLTTEIKDSWRVK